MIRTFLGRVVAIGVPYLIAVTFAILYLDLWAAVALFIISSYVGVTIAERYYPW